MYQKILVPMALNHDVSPQMFKVAETLLSQGGEIIALHVYEMPQGSVSVYLDEETVKEGYKKTRALLDEKLKDYPNVKPDMIKGHSARTIIDYANDNGVDCIVMGSHKPGLTDYLLGSTAARVVRHANCPVHVLRPKV